MFPASLFPTPLYPAPLYPGAGKAPGGAVAPPGPSPEAGADIASILEDIAERLDATGAFDVDASGWGSSLAVLSPGASGPAFAVEYAGDAEQTISDIDYQVRDLRYTLTIAIRDGNPADRTSDLGRLASIARNALSGVPLGGVCQPYFSRLKNAAPVDAAHPEGRVRLDGTCRFVVVDDLSREED